MVRDPRSPEDNTRVAEMSTIFAVLARNGVGEAAVSGRALSSYRDGIAAQLHRSLLPFRPEVLGDIADVPLGVTVDTAVLEAALRAYTAGVVEVQQEFGDHDDRVERLIELGEQILAAIRPVAAMLTEDDHEDLVSTRTRTNGAWARLADLLLHTMEIEREGRLEKVHADPGAVPPVDVDPRIGVVISHDGSLGPYASIQSGPYGGHLPPVGAPSPYGTTL